VARARELFSAAGTTVPAAAKLLGHLEDVGLGYLTIGQPLTTLSGGERQRLKLATHMGDSGGVYVLDEPTTGLHLADVDQLLALLDRLVDSGKTVIVIEHHQAVMAHADHLLDLGPGAGADGGRVVFQGSPAELVEDASTLTGEHLRQYVRACGVASQRAHVPWRLCPDPFPPPCSPGSTACAARTARSASRSRSGPCAAGAGTPSTSPVRAMLRCWPAPPPPVGTTTPWRGRGTAS